MQTRLFQREMTNQEEGEEDDSFDALIADANKFATRLLTAPTQPVGQNFGNLYVKSILRQ